MILRLQSQLADFRNQSVEFGLTQLLSYESKLNLAFVQVSIFNSGAVFLVFLFGGGFILTLVGL